MIIFLKPGWCLIEWFLEYGFERLVVSLNFNGWHAKDVLVESGAPKCYTEHFLFNLCMVLLASGKGSGSISNGGLSCMRTAPKTGSGHVLSGSSGSDPV